ncbi:hypothetical protein KAS41_00315 [Candidatus Parcubacteria bacterium]|nr:hypothetical protein [Candidatus Parcubacteria bacterium]
MKRILVIEEKQKIAEEIPGYSNFCYNDTYWVSSFSRVIYYDYFKKESFDAVVINVKIFKSDFAAPNENFVAIREMVKKLKVFLVAPLAISDLNENILTQMINDGITITTKDRIVKSVLDYLK